MHMDHEHHHHHDHEHHHHHDHCDHAHCDGGCTNCQHTPMGN